MKKEKRFECVSSQGVTSDIYKVIVDKETGVNYLYIHGGGVTVLVDEEGKPIVTNNK